MPDEWLDKASGRWLTGPEVESTGGLTATVIALGEETMSDGNHRPVLKVKIAGVERVVAVNATNAKVLRAYLRGRPSASLVGKRVQLTTEIATNPRTGVSGPAVRIKGVLA